MAETREVAVDGVPGTPGIREVRPETGTQNLDTGIGSDGNPRPGIRRVNLRAEIDTSPPFGSVKEAVTHFGGSGPWIPLYKLGEAFNSIEDFNLKKVEEQAAELEKDLIVKELETLDVLEELGATKKIVEELKQQLQIEALKCFATPDINSSKQVGTPIIKEMNKENYGNIVNNQEQILHDPIPCYMSSPDLILMELKQAKINLGKTINELGVIQSSVESLNKKMKKEKIFLDRTREKLALKFMASSAQEKTQEQTRVNPPAAPEEASCTFGNPVNIVGDFSSDAGQRNRMVETRKSEISKALPVYEDNGFSIKTAEMRWFAAKKMEEAARAAEAIALAEIKALSRAERSSGFALPEPKEVTFALGECSPLNPKAPIPAKAIALAEIKALSRAERSSVFALPEPEEVTFALGECSPLNPKVPIPEESTLKKVIDSKFQIDGTFISKLTILKKLEEASEEVLQSKQILTDALNRVETANRKQHAAEEALRRWIPEEDLKGQSVYNSINHKKFNQAGNCHNSPLPDVSVSTTTKNNQKPAVLRSTVSMRDVLSRKQVPEEYATRKEMEDHTERQKVALSQMLRALREDLTLTEKAEKNGSDQKQFMTQRKKFGFIQISLPLARPSKKRA